MTGYARMLAATQDLPRLLAHVTDPHWQRRLFLSSGEDAATVDAIHMAEDLIVSSPAPAGIGLVALTELAASRELIGLRNANLPTLLPVVWAELGEQRRAVALARSLADDRRPDAVLRLIQGLAQDAQPQEAESLVSLLPAHRQPEALVSIARALPSDARGPSPRKLVARAQEIAMSPGTRYENDYEDRRAWAAVAGGWAHIGDLAQAKLVASQEAYRRAELAVPVTTALVHAGETERARSVALSVDYAYGQEKAVAAAAAALAETGDQASAEALLAQVPDYCQHHVVMAMVRRLSTAKRASTPRPSSRD